LTKGTNYQETGLFILFFPFFKEQQATEKVWIISCYLCSWSSLSSLTV